MKKLILCLALFGLSGSVFAQSCESFPELEGTPCACLFATNLLAMGDEGVTHLETFTRHDGGGAYLVQMMFQCPGASEPSEYQIIFMNLYGPKDGRCRTGYTYSLTLDEPCVDLGGFNYTFPNNTGQEYRAEKKALRDVLKGFDY